MLFTFGNRVLLGGVSGVLSLITTDEHLQQNLGCYFSMRLLHVDLTKSLCK